MSETSGMTASFLFAKACGYRLEGMHRCYACGQPCHDKNRHGLARPVIGEKRDPKLRCPASPYLCNGCMAWNAPSRTVSFLTNTELRDRQSAKKHSWYASSFGAWGLRRESKTDATAMWERLLHPPIPFFLSVLDLSADPKVENKLYHCVVNDELIVRGDTELTFTVNNQPLTYTVYELETARTAQDPTGLSPGVRFLWDWLGPIPREIEAPKREHGGRPAEPIPSVVKTVKKVIRKS